MNNTGVQVRTKTVTKIAANPALSKRNDPNRIPGAAAYCRVSTDDEDQLNSYRTQKSYYTELIKKNPKWRFAGIYADEGITGTMVKKRDDFLRMIEDCEKGKIDLILIKSVSRYARNIVDCISYVRKLKALGIGIYFEEQNINSLTEDSEVYIGIYGVMAQSESENISANVKWGINKRMQNGTYACRFTLLGYRRNKDTKEIYIVPEEAENVKKKVAEDAARLEELSVKEKELDEKVTKIMMTIPNIIDPSVPIGKDDSENVEITRYGEPVVPDFEIPYHSEIMERLNGIDLDSARRVAGNGFYYLMGDIARLHSAVLAYARDFMIDRGFTYCIPPYMIRSNVVTGVMSFAEMDAMMYKIEGEDLYLIGTSEHSMIGKFIDTILEEDTLPRTLTSYSPCFRKEKGAHGIEERGVYRIHQFEKQEMIVVCKPEDSKMWFDKLWQNTVDLFRSMDIPVRTIECCSGDLADLKVKSYDVEAWSPRQKKYFEVGSCSNLGDAQARRLKIRVNGSDGKKYFAHTLNNTVVAPPRMLIAFLENNLNADGTVNIPEVLRPYMGGKSKIG